MSDPLQQLWLSEQSQALPTFSTEDIVNEAEKLSKTLWWRDARELLAAALVIVTFAYKAWFANNTMSLVGEIVCGLSAVWVAVVLLAKRPKQRPALTEPVDSHIAWHRKTLVDQGEMLRQVWLWYVAPITVGVLLSYGGGVLNKPSPSWTDVIYPMIVLVLAVALSLFNRKAGDQLLARARSF
jgi:hypothetical protein